MPRANKAKSKVEDDSYYVARTFIKSLAPANSTSDGLIPGYYPPSRHLRAAQAAYSQSSVYTTTSKQQRAQKSQDQQKISAADVEIYLKQKGYIDQNAVISDNFEDPYTELDKFRFHDAWRRDSVAKRAIGILADFTLGERTMNTLDITNDIDDEDKQRVALEAITNNQTYQGYRNELDRIDKDVNFDHFLTAAFIQAKVFGRACLIIQDDPETKLPIALKIVSSMRLGRVFIDEMTWKVVALEYLDYEGLDSIIPAQNMIYFTVEDTAVSPNVYGFGYSVLEPVIDIAEINRQLWSVAIKEINKSQWAPYLIIKMNTKRKSVMDKVANNLKPGIPFVHNQDMEIQTIEMNHDLQKILQEIDTNERVVAYTIGVPNFLIGKEDVTNRATTASVVDAWSKSKLQKERTWLCGILEPQWNDRNLKIIIETGIVEKNMTEDKQPLITTEYTDPRTGLKTTGNVNPKNPFTFGDGNGNGKKKPNPFAKKSANAADPTESPSQQQAPEGQSQQQEDPYASAMPKDTEISKLPFKIKRDFQAIVLDTLFETAGPIAQLITAGVIDETKAREVLHFDDIEDRMSAKEKEQELKNQQMMSQFQQMKGAENKAMTEQQKKAQEAKQKLAAARGQVGQMGGGSSGGLDVGANAPSLSANASYLESSHSAVSAAVKLRMAVDKRRLALYDEIADAVHKIERN